MITIETLKRHIGGVQNKMNFDTVLPFVKTAERDFRRVIGAALFTYLETAEGELKDCAEGCICWMAFDMALPHLKLRIGDLGMMKVSPANTVAITKWEYVDMRESNVAMVDIFWEFFWEELEIVSPTAWTESDEFKRRRGLFISSASEFSIYAPLVGRNRRFFGELTRYIKRAEDNYISETIHPEVLQELKTKYQAGTLLTAVEVSVIEQIRFASAYLALFEAYPYLPITADTEGVRQIRKKDGIREEDIAEKPYRQAQRIQLWQDGQLYLGQLTKLMNKYASPTQFPAYHNANTPDEPDDFTNKSHVLL